MTYSWTLTNISPRREYFKKCVSATTTIRKIFERREQLKVTADCSLVLPVLKFSHLAFRRCRRILTEPASLVIYGGINAVES